MLLLKVLLLLNLHVVLGENCSSATSCSECVLLDDACYWCSALATETSISGCLRFNTDKIAELLCPSKWVQNKKMCTVDENNESLNLLKLPELSTKKSGSDFSELATNYFNNVDYPNDSVEDSSKHFQLPSNESKGSELKDLLHKLLILKLLHKIKNKESGLTEEERKLIYTLSDKTNFSAKPTTTATTAAAAAAATTEEPIRKTNELAELLMILRNEAERRLRGNNLHQTESENGVNNKIDNLANKLKNEVESIDAKTTEKEEEKSAVIPIVTTELVPISKVNKSLASIKQNTDGNIITTTETNVIKGYNHIEKVNVKYEEKNEESLEELVKEKTRQHFNNSLKSTIKTMLKTMRTTLKSATHTKVVTYCKLFEENTLCNSDHNCTWCNTLDTCIHRNNDDYKNCVKNMEQLVDDQYGKMISCLLIYIYIYI